MLDRAMPNGTERSSECMLGSGEGGQTISIIKLERYQKLNEITLRGNEENH